MLLMDIDRSDQTCLLKVERDMTEEYDNDKAERSGQDSMEC